MGKVVGSIGSVAGGLALGKEGPLVHTGACIASLLGQGGSTKYHVSSHWVRLFKNDRDRRDLVRRAGESCTVIRLRTYWTFLFDLPQETFATFEVVASGYDLFLTASRRGRLPGPERSWCPELAFNIGLAQDESGPSRPHSLNGVISIRTPLLLPAQTFGSKTKTRIEYSFERRHESLRCR